MKRLFGLLLTVSLFVSCTNLEKDRSQASSMEIEAADRAMSRLAGQEGFNRALLAYADEGVVKPSEGRLPIIGKSALTEAWSGKPGPKSISWEPFQVEASASGDLGYSLGYWKDTKADTTLHGFYYTIWKRQKDGSWKFVADGGNGTPPPVGIDR